MLQGVINMYFDLPFIYVAFLVCNIKGRTEIEGVYQQYIEKVGP